jgi:hypothetical protein
MNASTSTIGFYRPVTRTVEAMRYEDGFELAFLRDGERVRRCSGRPGVDIIDAYGNTLAHVTQGDWIVKGFSGGYEVLDAPTFARRFEAVSE